MMSEYKEQEQHAKSMLKRDGYVEEVYRVNDSDLSIVFTSIGNYVVSLKTVEIGDTIRRLERDGVKCREVIKNETTG